MASNADNIAFLAATADNAAATSSGYSLSNIPILEKDNWAAFIKTAKAWLIMSHYDDLITTTEPEQEEDEDDEAWLARYSRFTVRTLRAVTGLRTRLGTTAEELVDDSDIIISTMLATLESNFKAAGTGELFDLIIKFWHLRLADYKGIEEYAAEFIHINKKLGQISEGSALPDLHMVLKFLDGPSVLSIDYTCSKRGA
jgi:hypothetical protein